MAHDVHRRAGMTLVEFALACGLIGLVLALAAGIYNSQLDKLKVEAARSLIAALSRAASQYLEAAGAYPPGRPDASCDRALTAMHSAPQSAGALAEVSGPWIAFVDGLPRCIDPWGRPVRYVTERSDNPDHRRRLFQSGGVPIFECAGPDRDFGDAAPTGQLDNIRSDDAG